MNKPVLSLASATATLLLSGAAAAFGQNSLNASPSSTTISNPSGSFNVTLTLATSATNISSFDLFLQSSSAGLDAGMFKITLTTPAVSGATAAAAGQNPDLISTGSTYGDSGRATNNVDQGFGYSADQTIANKSFTLETLQLSYSFNQLPAPGTSFTFTTTPSGAGGAPGTYFYSDDAANINAIDTPASFTVNVVPEPSTWALMAVGALGSLGSVGYRRKLRGNQVPS